MIIRSVLLCLFLAPFLSAYSDIDEHKHPMHKKRKIDKVLLASVSLDSGIRFHRLKQEGPCTLSFTPANTAVEVNSRLDNRYTFILSEINIHANFLFYGGFAFQFDGGYGAFPAKTHIRTNVDWSDGALSPTDYYVKAHTYSAAASVRVSKWFQINSWFKFNLFFGWGYELLRLMQQAHTQFSSPFIGVDFRFAFARRFVAHFEGMYAFSGEQDERLRLFYPSVEQTTVEGLSPSALFSIKRGKVYGPKARMKVTYTFHRGWHFLYGMDFTYMKTKERKLFVNYINTSSTSPSGSSSGRWYESTLWSSFGVWLGVERQF